MIRRLLLSVAILGVMLASVPAGADAGEAPKPKAAPAPVQQEEYNDTILLTNNNPVTPVKVVEDRWDAVIYKMPGGVAEGNPCPADTVEGVAYASRPADYEKAQELKRARKFDDALRTFDDGLRKLKANEAAQRQYFLMGKIECLAAKRNPEGISKLIDEMLAAGKENPPRLIFAAYSALGAAFFQNRKFEEAEKASVRAAELFKSLEDKARSGGKASLEKYINRYRLEVKLRRIGCLEMQGKIEGASPETAAELAYQLFPSQDGAALYPELVAQADVGRGRCMALRKDYVGALRHFEALERKIPAVARPSLYAALGDVYLARANSERRDELDYPQARWYYLKVVVQHPADRAALAHAYYGAGLCYEALPKEIRSGERKLKMFETVTKEFPDSPEFVLANEKLSSGKG